MQQAQIPYILHPNLRDMVEFIPYPNLNDFPKSNLDKSIEKKTDFCEIFLGQLPQELPFKCDLKLMYNDENIDKMMITWLFSKLENVTVFNIHQRVSKKHNNNMVSFHASIHVVDYELVLEMNKCILFDIFGIWYARTSEMSEILREYIQKVNTMKDEFLKSIDHSVYNIHQMGFTHVTRIKISSNAIVIEKPETRPRSGNTTSNDSFDEEYKPQTLFNFNIMPPVITGSQNNQMQQQPNKKPKVEGYRCYRHEPYSMTKTTVGVGKK